MQFQAGYINDGLVPYLIENGCDKERIEGLLKYLSFFEINGIDSNYEQQRTLDPLLCVLDNLISRGLPTYSSILVENYFSEELKITRKVINSIGAISHPIELNASNFIKHLYNSLHIILPDNKFKHSISKKIESWEKLGSKYEENFYLNLLPIQCGKYIIQIVDSQRNIVSIIRFAQTPSEGVEKYLFGSIDNFDEQSIDFTMEFPFKINDKNGIAIEIDGSQHKLPQQQNLDRLRDDALSKANWHNTIRIDTDAFENISVVLSPLKDIIKDEYFRILQENYNNPIWDSLEGKLAIQYSLAPFAIARLHKSLIYLIKNGVLSLEVEKWVLGVIERDVAFANLAIEDFKNLLEKLFVLKGDNRKLPEIEIHVVSSSIFSELNNDSETIYSLNNIKFDIVFDVSILCREGIDLNKFELKTNNYIIIKSSNSIHSERRFETSELINYEPFITFENNSSHYNLEKINILKDLLQNIFRKLSFRPGQLEIINRALNLQSVVGLLPTGRGKSLSYQISSLLQPGVTLIVDPIKSLMKDQYVGLIRQRIDCVVYINSSIRSAKERELATNKMAKANVLFTFISPERLQLKPFRNKLSEMYEKHNNSFSYCVIDEAHCVSEWGHDFRTSYLRLGENARRFCKINHNDVNSIPIIGLTATASFDVLSDVQRELDLGEEAIIRLDSSDRPELIYKIFEVNYQKFASNDFEDRKQLGEVKQEILIELLNRIEEEFKQYNANLNLTPEKIPHQISDILLNNFFSHLNSNKNSGLIFCPHKAWYFGVEDIAAKISELLNGIQVGTFTGSSGENEQENQEQSILSEKNQDDFIGNELDILVATKAFGMGIDKPNIRFTIHLNYPSSIESFYQEAGRAGRDRKLGLCFILYAGHKYERELLESFFFNSFKGEDKEKWILWELLDEITYPVESKSYRLKQHFSNTINSELYLSLWPKENPTRLYVKKSSIEEYGYISIPDLAYKISENVLDASKATNELNNVRNELRNLEIDNMDFNAWLNQDGEKEPIEGIERQLNRINVSETLPPITVGFRNNKIRLITELLKDRVANDFSERIVSNASNYCNNFSDFSENLSKEYKKQFGRKININDNVLQLIKPLFYKIRDDLDTFKAIYRLSVIGVIDDYEVDYNSKTVNLLQIKKKTDEEYIDRLYQYLIRYLSKSRADNMKEEIINYQGNSTIQKCLGYLIKFVYSEIAKKRKNSIISMQDACEKGKGNGAEEFREYLNLYFNSKYYPELRDKTNMGKEAPFAIVIEYIKITEGAVDNIKHLRGVTIRLLNEYPDNPALILLKCFTLYMLELNNERFLKEAEEDFKRGFLLFKELEKLEFIELTQRITEFNSLIISYNGDLTETLTQQSNILLVDHHISWLIVFNNKFMVSNGR